jgi:hypothetical protein
MEEDSRKRKEQIEVLREKSRRQYLEKREEDQLLALEADLKDEEYLFESEELTEKERHKLKSQKELLAIAKEYRNVHEQVIKKILITISGRFGPFLRHLNFASEIDES